MVAEQRRRRNEDDDGHEAGDDAGRPAQTVRRIRKGLGTMFLLRDDDDDDDDGGSPRCQKRRYLPNGAANS